MKVLYLQRVIIIKHGEIKLESEMFEDLENYMKMNTYLESNDPWFWPKLRYFILQKKTFMFWTKQIFEFVYSGKSSKIFFFLKVLNSILK